MIMLEKLARTLHPEWYAAPITSLPEDVQADLHRKAEANVKALLVVLSEPDQNMTDAGQFAYDRATKDRQESETRGKNSRVCPLRVAYQAALYEIINSEKAT